MEKQDFNLREWAHKARISRENTFSRRFSGSNIISLGEETRSFRSNLTISSTASSPGYTLRDEIDPNTYSFTNALKALQARTISRWECLSPDGFALNSKWNDAEKYICNPLSGEVPVECLSAKTLSGRVRNNSRSFTSRLTMSGPLLQSNNSNVRIVQPKSTIAELHETLDQSPIQDNKVGSLTRDVGTQSTPPDVSSSSPSPTSTPSAKERPLNHWEAGGYSPDFRIKANSKEEIEEKEKRERIEETSKEGERRKDSQMCKCRQGVCSPLSLWMRNSRPKQKHKPIPRPRPGAWKLIFGRSKN